jgi:hypothetical protein
MPGPDAAALDGVMDELYVDDVQAEYERMQALGANFTRSPTKVTGSTIDPSADPSAFAFTCPLGLGAGLRSAKNGPLEHPRANGVVAGERKNCTQDRTDEAAEQISRMVKAWGVR